MQWLSEIFFQQIWYILVFCYVTYSAIIYYLSVFSKRLFAKSNPNNKPDSFVSQLKNLPKLPSHVALSFQYDSKNSLFFGSDGNENQKEENENYLDKPTLDLKKIAEVTSWIAGAGIPIIGLYDYHGTLKFQYATLKSEVEEAVSRFCAEITIQEEEIIPLIFWHKILPGSRCTSLNIVESQKMLIGQKKLQVHIFIYSYDDGKPKLLEMVKEMYLEKFQNNAIDQFEEMRIQNQRPLIDVNTVNEYLKKECCESLKMIDYKIEPDLLLNFGSTKSTLEFLPWHIRLTELHWLPQVKHVQLSEVLTSFYKFAKCEQRFGK